MSMWGPGPGDNDDAADWLADLADEPAISALNEALDQVLDADEGEYLEVTEGALAVASAALVMSLLAANDASNLLDDQGVDRLREQIKALDPGAVSSLAWRAGRALRKVACTDCSELAQLLEDEPDWVEPWRRHLQSLIERLDGFRGRLPPA